MHRAAVTRAVVRNQVVDDRGLDEVGDRDTASPATAGAACCRIARDDVADEYCVTSGKKGNSAAARRFAAVVDNDVADNLGSRVAANVDTDAPSSGASGDDVAADRVVLDTR